MTRTRWILGAVILAAVTNSLYMALIWWCAAFSGIWVCSPKFNGIQEQWVEGILFHLFVLVSVYAVWYFRPGGKYGKR